MRANPKAGLGIGLGLSLSCNYFQTTCWIAHQQQAQIWSLGCPERPRDDSKAHPHFAQLLITSVQVRRQAGASPSSLHPWDNSGCMSNRDHLLFPNQCDNGN